MIWRSRLLVVVLLAILAIPAFMNIKSSSHDWGGDFAMYILQARNIVDGRSQLDTGYVYASETSYYPRAFPAGFPLALSPVYKIFGNSIYHFNLLIALMTLGLSWLSFYYFRSCLRSVPLAFTLTAVFVFNPWLIDFKSNILSDIQFSLLCLLVLYLEERSAQHRGSAILQGLCLGLAWFTRELAIAFLLALLIPHDRSGISSRRIWSLISALGVWVLFSQILFPTHSFASYLDEINWGDLSRAFKSNVDYYLKVFQDVVPRSGPTFIQILLWNFIVSGGILGCLHSIKRQGHQYRDWVVIIYFLILFVWPFRQGYRFLLPITPILLLYYYEFGSWIAKELFPEKVRRLFLPLTLIFFALVYYEPLRSIQSKVSEVIDGPQEPQAMEMFERVHALVAPSAIVLFHSPSPLALYAGCKGLAEPESQWSDEMLTDYLERYGATYVLVDQKLSGDGIKQWASDPTRASVAWQNSRFILYRTIL
jgi:hypothetical protein